MEIKEAITKPNSETEQKAWETVVPLVFKLKRFFEFSSKLEDIVPKICNMLCTPDPMSTGYDFNSFFFFVIVKICVFT